MFNHTQCGRTCAFAVACLCPQNSNSNVVASLTIDDNIYIHVRCSKKHENIVEGHKHIHVRRHVHLQTRTHTHTHTLTQNMYMYMYILVEEGEEGGDKPNDVPRIAETEQLHQAQRMIGGIGNVLLSRLVLKLKMGKIHWFLVVNL